MLPSVTTNISAGKIGPFLKKGWSMLIDAERKVFSVRGILSGVVTLPKTNENGWLED